MKNLLFLLFILLYTMPLPAQEIIGTWEGTLDIQGTQLPIVFHIEEIDGILKATMDSPKQGAYGLETDSCIYAEGKLSITAKQLIFSFSGEHTGDKLEGTFKQKMATFPLSMERSNASKATPKRPQDPSPPFPYLSEEVTFMNKKADIQLAGTLTRPKEVNNPPVVILISGSGAQNRDSEVLNHRPFLIWADHLTRQGIAVLRFDERGVGASEGDFAKATSEDFAADIKAAVQFIKQQKAFKKSQLGLIGHSEGGIIAPMVAVDQPKAVDFIILLAAPGVPIINMMYEQNVKLAEGRGFPALTKTMFLNQQKAIFELVKTTGHLSTEEMRDTVFDFYEQRNGGINLRENTQIIAAVDQFSSPWMRFFLAYDPTPALENVEVPLLAINGDKDTQVVAEQNMPGIEAALKKSGNLKGTTRIFPGLNHLFQTAETGQAEEYAQIGETVNPEVLKFVTTWIKDTL